MQIYLVCALVLVSLVAPVHLGSPCPSPSDIIPCKCTKDEQDTIVQCQYQDQKILKEAFKAMSDLDMIIDSMVLVSSGLTFVNVSFFQDLTVRSAIFDGKQWTSIEDYAFEGQENSLESIIILESQLTKIPINAISQLHNLRSFHMVRSEVSKIAENAFENFLSASVLRILNLQDNYIDSVGKGAFKTLVALQNLDLSGNKISSLPAGILPSNNKIETFSMRKNLLEKVPGDIDTFAEEAKLDFSSNRIEKILGTALRTIIEKRLSVNLENNPLNCGCPMRIITTTDDTVPITGTCTEPASLVGKNLQSLSPADFAACYFKLLLAKL